MPSLTGVRYLKKGMKGDDVAAVQRALTAAGFSTKGVDGDYGNDTSNAVSAYQRARGITVDGEVGPETLSALNADAAKAAEAASNPAADALTSASASRSSVAPAPPGTSALTKAPKQQEEGVMAWFQQDFHGVPLWGAVLGGGALAGVGYYLFTRKR